MLDQALHRVPVAAFGQHESQIRFGVEPQSFPKFEGVVLQLRREHRAALGLDAVAPAARALRRVPCGRWTR